MLQGKETQMGIRVTGISTPVGGLSWEYTRSDKQNIPLIISPGQKIKVFISSICGVEKYDKVRAELKSAIEATQLADAYTFESKGASTLTAGDHYTFALEESDICIFLIDNADGIRPRVQGEIDTVKKYNIKALYYFCDENQKEKTALEQSLMGAHLAKSKTVHSFSELSKDGAQALIEDIIAIYHYYCKGRIIVRPDERDEVQEVEIAGAEKYQLPTIPKATLKNVDKCRDYILKFVLGYSRSKFSGEKEKSSEIDEWGLEFLQVLLEGKSIKRFNTAMYMETLKGRQEKEHYQIVCIRWQAIQAYFSGDIEKCVEYLEEALKLAKNIAQPTWVVKDILVDLRNQHWTYCTVRNEYSELQAQKELTESSEELYYPILDRIHESLHEKYIKGLYKKKTESPYSVTIGNNLDQYGEMLASSLIVSMYNGSLTHILLIYEKIRDFVFYLSCKYDDWKFRLNLYKLSIFAGKEKEINGIQDSYPEVLNNLTADEAESIMDFCLNHPIKYKRLCSQLVRHINCVLDNEKEREQIKYSPLFLCVLRRQNYAITEEMDKKIAEYLPSYYGDTYRLEITENENEDMPGFVREYAERIRKSNETQGKNGIFFGHGTREIATVRAILLEKEFVCDSEIIDVLISTVADTLLIFKGKYRYKT